MASKAERIFDALRDPGCEDCGREGYVNFELAEGDVDGTKGYFIMADDKPVALILDDKMFKKINALVIEANEAREGEDDEYEDDDREGCSEDDDSEEDDESDAKPLGKRFRP